MTSKWKESNLFAVKLAELGVSMASAFTFILPRANVSFSNLFMVVISEEIEQTLL